MTQLGLGARRMKKPTEARQPLVGFDVGNTSVKCAVRRVDGWHVIFRVATAPADTLCGRMTDALPSGGDRDMAGAVCVASSVHPAADGALAAFCTKVTGAPPRFLGRDLPIPLATRVRQPHKVGADRLLLALGARALCRAPYVVVGAGTAITVDLVDADGCFAGGAIAPGFGLAASALHGAAALLPEVRLSGPAAAPGADTEEALRAGVYWSCAGGVLALIDRYQEAAARDAIPVVCTGTDAPLLLPVLPPGALHEPELIFQGMEAALEGRRLPPRRAKP